MKQLLLLAFVFFCSVMLIASRVSSEDKSSTLTTVKEETEHMQNYTKPSLEEMKQRLTAEQIAVTQHEGTERPFQNEYWDNKEAGIYVDVVTGEPLFSSLDKYDSGTGWPSFTKPLEPTNVKTKTDTKLFQPRTEVRSKHGDSHLGHVFNDGPGPTGERYCMNSASLRFVPASKLAEEGYGEYGPLFGLPSVSSSTTPSTEKKETALLAGGCFWGMEDLIRAVPGVISTRVGYTGGSVPNPLYKAVSGGASGHAESIEVTFDPAKLSFADLLRFFFKIHDPTTLNRQGNDRGTQYRSAIFVGNDEQKKVAEEVKAEVDKSGKWTAPVVTEITEAGPFYEAETYHQDYLLKNPGGYTCHFIRE